ncbi:MAG: hypothetical protein HYX27_00790 [Acidobacteria bacterium]|nr:hypothetical protein [Acidobacteriota bacterium]
MERELLDRLLAEYATGGLSEDDKKILFAAALEDQELFNQLMDEDALREAIEMPGARNRLIDVLQEDLVETEHVAAAAAPVFQMQSGHTPPQAPGQGQESKRRPFPPPAWLAWAAGLGVVFVSGALTYVMFEKSANQPEVASVRTATKDVKPFVQPSSAEPPAKTPPVFVDAPPKIATVPPAVAAPPISIPLPSAPPPPAPEGLGAKEKEVKSADTIASARTERDQAFAENRAAPQQVVVLPVPSNQQFQAPPAPAPALARRQSAPASAAVATGAGGAPKKMPEIRSEELEDKKARAEKARLDAPAPPSVWRRAGDGVWVRVPAGDTIGRNETISIRYTATTAQGVALLDERGVRLDYRSGRIGEELSLSVPHTLLERASGDSLSLSIIEGTAAMGFVGGVARERAAGPQQPVKILLRLR